MQRWIIDDTVYSIYGCMDPRSYLHCSAEQMYRFEFKKLLCGLARSLKPADCRYLRYLYSEETALCTISPGDEGSALELVEALERACVVSWERPDRVGEVMRHLGREDCYREVESFVRKSVCSLRVRRCTSRRTLAPKRHSFFCTKMRSGAWMRIR